MIENNKITTRLNYKSKTWEANRTKKHRDKWFKPYPRGWQEQQRVGRSSGAATAAPGRRY